MFSRSESKKARNRDFLKIQNNIQNPRTKMAKNKVYCYVTLWRPTKTPKIDPKGTPQGTYSTPCRHPSQNAQTVHQNAPLSGFCIITIYSLRYMNPFYSITPFTKYVLITIHVSKTQAQKDLFFRSFWDQPDPQGAGVLCSRHVSFTYRL